jgi:diacylglycerol kinase (ATP)
MKLAVVHNPNAFQGESACNEMLQIFERAGHEVAHTSTEEPNWQRVISAPNERVIIVGGDGTVQSVAPYLRETKIPFHILPSGTANNIAQCLKQTSSPELLATHLEHAAIGDLDIGTLGHSDSEKMFLECAGVGVFAELMFEMQKWPQQSQMEMADSRKEKFARALKELRSICDRYEGAAWELKVDDTPLADRFLLIALVNMELIGPKLHLAPSADPADGYLDFVCVREAERKDLSRWLEDQSPGHLSAASFECRRCRQVEIHGSTSARIHADSHLIEKPESPLVIKLEPAALSYGMVKERPGAESEGW